MSDFWISPVPTKDKGTTDDGMTFFFCSSKMATVNLKLLDSVFQTRIWAVAASGFTIRDCDLI